MNIYQALEKHSNVFLIICMFIFLFFNMLSIQKPFVLDEASFVDAAKAINEKGVPIFYEGEEAKEKVGLWHPPLYINLLAASFRIFGVNEVSAHLIGTLFALGTIFLIYMLSLEVFKERHDKQLIALSGSFIYSINPLVLQNAILVDIDTSILTFLAILFVFVFIKSMQVRYVYRMLILGLLFGIFIWAKFGSIFIIVSIFLYHVLNREYKKGFLDTGIIVFIGAFFFLLSWFIYSYFTHLPFFFPFQHNLTSGSFDERGMRLLLKALWGIKNFSFWITPPFILLVFVVLFERIKNYIKINKLLYTDLLLICGMTVFIAYSIIRTNGYGFPKYHAPAIPFFSILIGELVVRSDIIKNLQQRYFPLIAGFFTIFVYLFFIVKDPLLFPYKQEYEILVYTNVLAQFIELTIYKVIFYILPILLFFIILKILKIAMKPSTMITISLIFALITVSIYVDFVQGEAKYSTTYNYGEMGLRETASYIREHTDSNDIIIGETDLGYYTRRPYYRAFFALASSDKLQEVINSNYISYLVFRKNDLWKNEVKEVINSKYIQVEDIGSFVIYEKI